MNIRRRFVIALAAGTLTAPLAGFAQPPTKVWRIGLLWSISREQAFRKNHATSRFLQGLRDLGYVEGRNIAIEWRFADDDNERLPALAAELVKLKVDVIVTVGTPGVRAAREATSTIPIVTASFADPVASGFAASLARPGGNITGLSNMSEDTDVKRLDLLSGVLRKNIRIAYLMNPENAAVAKIARDIKVVAGKVGKDLLIFDARTPDEIPKAVAAMIKQRAGALIIGDDNFLNDQAGQIAELSETSVRRFLALKICSQ